MGFVIRSFVIFLLLLASGQGVFAGEQFAFLVGVREYDKAELTTLRYTEKDINALADVLKKSGYQAQNVVVMTQALGAKKTRFLPIANKIRRELDLLIGEMRKDDTLIVAFSGHGVQFKGGKDAYFCPADAKLKDKTTLISLGEIYQLLSDPKRCKAQTKILLVDACRNDPQSKISKAVNEVELEPAGKPQDVVLPGGIAAFFSCSAGQKSYEDPDFEHGIFFKYVIEALSGKGDYDKDQQISLAELELYTLRKVQQYVRVELGHRQTPERKGKAHGLVAIVRLGLSSTSPKSTAPLPNPKPPHSKMPKALKAPFDLKAAQESQKQWASTLKREVKETIDLGNGISLEMVLIPPGTYQMGAGLQDSQAKADGPEHEKPQHSVTISKPFYLGIHEVTAAQYRALVSNGGFGTGNSPATGMSCQEIEQGFLKSLNQKIPKAGKFRLPTEAEWEYACRAGTTSRFSYGDSLTPREANVWREDSSNNPNGNAKTPVGSYKPNAFGLFDMHGNVWEWCGDSPRQYSSKEQTDPVGSPGQQAVARGGSYHAGPHGARSSTRSVHPNRSESFLNWGFRIVRELP